MMENLYPLIFDCLAEYALFTLDTEGLITLWNKGAQKITGFSSGEMLGKHFSVLFTQDDVISDLPLIEITTALASGKAICDRLLIDKKGERRLMQGFLFKMIDHEGRHLGYTKIVRDVTHEKELELQKDDSVGVVSHELKTPITGIKGYAEILSQKLMNSTDNSVLQPLARINSLADRLTGLVNYLLEVSKSQSVEITLLKEYFSLERLIEEVIDEVKASTKARHSFEFNAKTATRIFADRTRIAQVLVNLLTNAVKYSPNGRPVKVTLNVAPPFATVYVTDEGLGIPGDQQKLIFKRFARSQNVKKLKLPGVGLGLFISSEIIKYHKGTINFASEENRGSQFWFSIPMDAH